MIQFQNEFVVIELVNNATAISLCWKGFVPSAKYREALEKAIEIARKHRITNWISDIRLMKVLAVKDQEWAGTVWLPKVVSAGCYKKQAVIMPEDIFGKASASSLLTTVQNQQIEIQNFTSPEDAKQWLAQHSNKNVSQLVAQ
ncbi:hypothetical protein [Cesiribacter sp. SM1]|uniref:hypothetical protein n=1 Tax=Cesiribacter sp. SM1 TaxID=2861196 RepID=UPI001CD2BCAC|nr:hypothetical protein [Cesiribacter sp. SM1]